MSREGIERLEAAALRLDAIAAELAGEQVDDAAAVKLAQEAAQIAAEAGTTAAQAAEAVRSAAERGDAPGG